MKIGSRDFEFGKRTYIMGILNVTPDSFSDGGKYDMVDNAVRHAVEMIEEAADIIDIGGESTRPGHEEVSGEEEIRRVVPVIEKIREVSDIPISIDTSKASVARAAIEAGADMINDVWGFLKDPMIAAVAVQANVPCCLMHNSNDTVYKDFIPEVLEALKESVQVAVEAGVPEDLIILDPGIGFGKTVEQNLEMMAHLEDVANLGYPVLLGTSRKSMIGKTMDLPVDQRLEGTLATTVFGIVKGCSIIRVHDVKENERAARMTDIMLGRRGWNG